MNESIGYKLLSAAIYIFVGMWMIGVIKNTTVDEAGNLVVQKGISTEQVELSNSDDEDFRVEPDETGDEDVEETIDSNLLNEQIATFIALQGEWYIDDENDYSSYAVTDYDFDQNLEICRTTTEGTGGFSTNVFFEYDNGGLRELSFGGDYEYSQPDISCFMCACYYDSAENLYHYVVTDSIRSGYQESYSVAYFFTFDYEDELLLEKIKSSHTLMDDTGEVVTQEEYWNSEGESVDADEYNSLEETFFPGCEKKTCQFKWINRSKLKDNMEEKLYQSWEGFQLK